VVRQAKEQRVLGSKQTRSKQTRSKKTRKKAKSPPKDKALQRFLRRLYPEVKTDRGLRQKQHQTRAVVLVMDEPEFRWLFDAETGTCRNTILAELGRIQNDELLLEMAREVCRRKPKSREAVAAIRRFRGVRDEPNSRKLMVKLIKTIDEYLKRYPGTTWEQVQDAVAQAADVVDEATREPLE
jgi:hypothetical protein